MLPNVVHNTSGVGTGRAAASPKKVLRGLECELRSLPSLSLHPQNRASSYATEQTKLLQQYTWQLRFKMRRKVDQLLGIYGSMAHSTITVKECRDDRCPRPCQVPDKKL